MGFLSSLFSRKGKPLSNHMRDTLFGDEPLDRWPKEANAQGEPWSVFASARESLRSGNPREACNLWRRILAEPGLESRHYLQAWHFLRQQGELPDPQVAKQVLGIVVEVGMPEGLDILAAYPDHHARYYNYSGAAVIWECPGSSLDPQIDELLAASAQVVARIGPWEQPRPPAPPRDHARISFLTPSGLHFGQGSLKVLSRDPLAGPVLHLATLFMLALTAKVPRK